MKSLVDLSRHKQLKVSHTRKVDKSIMTFQITPFQCLKFEKFGVNIAKIKKHHPVYYSENLSADHVFSVYANLLPSVW